MAGIGVIGAGVSALHLGLYLRAHDVPVTLYTDRTGDEVASGRLLNTVAHHHNTLERERALGVHHWDAAEYGYGCHHHFIGGDRPLRFQGDFRNPSSIIDYRLYLPRLMQDLEERGGEFVYGGPLGPLDVDRLSSNHDLMVVAIGRGGLSSLFARRPEKSPYGRPQRRLSAGIYRGIAYSEPKGVGFCISPGHGELIELPIFCREGFADALLFENIPGADLEVLAEISYAEDPAAFNRVVLEKLERHYPPVFERVDPDAFGLLGPTDILQGALTPVVREDFTLLPSGTYALAMGDTHTSVDPLVGQGANSGSYSAWKVGEAIVEALAYDERFCRALAAARDERVMGISDWTNIMLNPPPHVLGLLGAMSQNRELCDAFTDNFDQPERDLDAVATAERAEAFIARHSVTATV